MLILQVKKTKKYTTTIFISTNFFLIDAMATGKINANFTWKKTKVFKTTLFHQFLVDSFQVTFKIQL